MAYTPKTYIDYPGDGITKTFAIPFSFLKQEFIKVLLNADPKNDESTFTPLTYSQHYSIYQDSITMETAHAKGTLLRVQRSTSTIPLVSWEDGSTFTADQLTRSSTQTLHITEELMEQAILSIGGTGGGNGTPGSVWYAGAGLPASTLGTILDYYLDTNTKDVYTKASGVWTKLTTLGGSSVLIGRPIYIFNTQAAMIACTTLVAGDLCQTLCYSHFWDDGGANYIIATEEEANNKSWKIPIDKATPDTQLYALCTNQDRVTYRMWGAPLNGTDDDGPAMRKCHAYADSVYIMDGPGNLKQYLCRVENHQGTIYKKDNETINFCSDIDLSGSTLLVDDLNAGWFGYYTWGEVNSLVWDFEAPDETKATFLADNFVIQQPTTSDTLPPNTVLKIEEDPYTARDDAGYLYTVARRELLIHDANGICSSPLTDDWNYAGGEEINCQISDLVNGGYKNSQSFTKFSCSYTFIPNRHGTFVGCDVEFKTSANKYCSVAWVKRHNATIQDFIFRPNLDGLHNTKFKNTMIYLWDCYNVRVQNLQGFNAAGQKSGSNGTSGYILRVTNCSDVYVEDCRMQGYWGATAMDSVKNIHFRRCHMNRLDIHDYFSNLTAEECTFYNHNIQIGYGRGVASFTNCNWYWNEVPNDSYPNSHMVELNATYGRIFEGMIFLSNCRVWTKNPPDGEFNIFLLECSPDATSITKHFKFPEVIVKDLQIYSNNPDIYLAYFKITGTRRATTGSLAPSHRTDYSNDGTVTWHYIGRGVEWGGPVLSMTVDQILRVKDSFLDTDGKTQFYNTRYYRCVTAGSLGSWGTKPTDTSGNPFTVGTTQLVYMPDALWQSKHVYAVNELCAANPSNFYPLYLFKCSTAGTSDGYFPTHTSGTALDGINDSVSEPDGCWWTYVTTKSAWCKDWTANMSVTVGQRIEAEGRLYEVVRAGTLIEYPPYDTYWFGESDCGTARLKFIGLKWKPKQWYKNDSFCEAGGRIYQLTNHDGTTSGKLPVRGNKYCVDGDHIWEFVSTGSSGTAWSAHTASTIGDTVTANGNTYKCVFDGKLTLPNRTTFENITTNITRESHVFWFYAGNNIPTKLGSRGTWELIARNCDGLSTTPFGSVTTYFGHSGNPGPTMIDTGGGGGASVSTVIASLPAHYQRDIKWQQGTARTKLKPPTQLTVNINNLGYILSSAAEIDISAVTSWDSTTPNYTVASTRAGKDFYIYVCQPSSGSTPKIVLSANGTVPTGYTTTNSRKIGGFHCLCLSVGTISGHTLSSYVTGDILPASIWDLNHRPMSTPEGMVYSDQANIWVDIYLQSGSGSSTASSYGGTITTGIDWLTAVDHQAAVKKRLLQDHEFQIVAEGSNQMSPVSGGSPSTTGGHANSDLRRTISNIGCEDCCGVLWQWLLDSSYQFGGATAHTHSVTVTGEAQTATTDNPSVDVAPAFTWKTQPGLKGSIYSQGTAGDVKMLAGGYYDYGGVSGSRSRNLSYSRSYYSSTFTARGCCPSAVNS